MRWCWVNFQCRGGLLILIIVGQGPIALAVGAGGGYLDIFFSRLLFLFSFSLSLGDDPIWTEILSQRAVKPKTTNQPALEVTSLMRYHETHRMTFLEGRYATCNVKNKINKKMINKASQAISPLALYHSSY